MPSHIRSLRTNIQTLTEKISEHRICFDSNVPIISGNGNWQYSITVPNETNVFLKNNLSYREIYDSMVASRFFNLKMIDGALINLQYLFENEDIIKHRLSFYPSPYLIEYQNNSELYLRDDTDEEYLQANEQNVVFPIRFDYDIKTLGSNHPISHLTLGRYKDCRIPVSAALTPFHFLSFVIENFYSIEFKNFVPCDRSCYSQSILDFEAEKLHINLPIYN